MQDISIADFYADHLKAMEQLTAELHAVNENLSRMNKTVQSAAEAVYAGQIVSARMISAKRDCDFNDAYKNADKTHLAILETFKEINNGNQKRQADPQGSQA